MMVDSARGRSASSATSAESAFLLPLLLPLPLPLPLRPPVIALRISQSAHEPAGARSVRRPAFAAAEPYSTPWLAARSRMRS